MALLRTVSGSATVSHSVPVAGEKINAKNSRGTYRTLPGGTWTYIALCGADTKKGFEAKELAQQTRACKRCLSIISKLYD